MNSFALILDRGMHGVMPIWLLHLVWGNGQQENYFLHFLEAVFFLCFGDSLGLFLIGQGKVILKYKKNAELYLFKGCCCARHKEVKMFFSYGNRKC